MTRTRLSCPSVSGLSALPDMAQLSAPVRSVRNACNILKGKNYSFLSILSALVRTGCEGRMWSGHREGEGFPPLGGNLSRPGHAPGMPRCPASGSGRHAIPAKADPQHHA